MSICFFRDHLPSKPLSALRLSTPSRFHALTAHAIKGDKERFLEVGMTDYISKPIDYKEFYKTIEKYL